MKKAIQLGKCIGVVVIACILSMPVYAETAYEFSGFASIVANKVLTSSNSNQSDRYDSMSKDFALRDLSVLGLRGNVLWEDGLGLTAQAVVYGYDDYKPRFDWIFASYDLPQGLQVSVGRMRTPLFMYSTYQDVSYATPWLSPPYSVYGIPKLMSFDGIKFRYQAMLGRWSSDLQLWYGLIDEQLKTNDLDARLRMQDNVGLAWDVEHNWLRLHSVYMQGTTSMNLDEQKDVSSLLSAVKQQSPQLAKQLEWDKVKAHYAGVGIGLDFDRMFFNSEATYIYIDDNIATAQRFQSYYLTVGVRPLSEWSMSMTLAYDRDREHARLSKGYQHMLNQTGQTQLPTVQEFEQLVYQLQRYDSKGFILGTRWDFHRSASAKIEYLAEQRRYGKDSKRYRPQVIRFGVDLVF